MEPPPALGARRDLRRLRTQGEDLLLAEPVGDRLGRPLRVAMDGAPGRAAGLLLLRREVGGGTAPRQEVAGRRLEVDRLVELQAARVQAGVEAHAQVAMELGAKLVEALLVGVE